MQKRTVLFLAMVLVFIGCAQQCGESAYRNEVFDHVRGHQFDASAKELWKETHEILTETGFKIPKSVTPTKESALSDWQGKPGARTRYSVRIIKAGKDKRQLQITKIDENKVGIYAEGAFEKADAGPPEPIDYKMEVSRSRDLNMEWDIVQRLDPAEATVIKQAAKEREEAVRQDVANGCQ